MACKSTYNGRIPLEELEVKVRGSDRIEALDNLRKWVIEKYGFLFSIKPIVPLQPTSDGRWYAKFRIEVDKSLENDSN